MSGYSYETGEIKTFTALDYVLFGLVLLVSAGIGLFFAIKDRKKDNTKDFLLAGGNMNPVPVAMSILASFMSAITLLGTPAEMYNFTTIYFWIGLSYLLVVAGAAHIFIPVFYRMRVTSAYEYLEQRFSKGVRTAGSLTFCTQMILYMAIVLYAPSLALNAVTGFTLWGSVISVGVVCTFYTTLGGMKAVLWTDTFQIGMMFAGLFAIVIKGTAAAGGLSEVWKYSEESGRFDWIEFSPDPTVRHTIWSLVIGGMFTWIAIYGTNQAQVQRACACSSLKEAQIAMWVNFPGLCLILYLGCFIGLAMYTFYRKCDPLQFNLVSASDQLLPLFVMDVLGDIHGVPGLFVASLFSGALSTISSGLNSMAACVLEDVIKAYFVKDMTESRATLVSRILALIFGIVCLGLTYVASHLGSVLQAALSLFGMIGGPLLGLFTLGMIFPWANYKGAFAGLFGGLGLTFWIGIGAQIYKPVNPKATVSVEGCNWNLTTTAAAVTSYLNTTTSLPLTTPRNITDLVTSAAEMATVADDPPLYGLYKVSYIWYSAIAVAAVVVIGLVVSFLTGPTKAADIDPRLMAPLFDIMFPFLPEKILKPLRFGVKYSKTTERADIIHTAADLEQGKINKYFDTSIEVELSSREHSSSTLEKEPDDKSDKTSGVGSTMEEDSSIQNGDAQLTGECSTRL